MSHLNISEITHVDGTHNKLCRLETTNMPADLWLNHVLKNERDLNIYSLYKITKVNVSYQTKFNQKVVIDLTN